MTRVGWARPDSLFRRVFTNMLIPGASEEQMRWVDALQRMSTSTDNAVRLRAERHKIDITDLLSQVTVPTLVLHSRGDAMVRFEEARLMASSIPRARLVPLESQNHILLAGEPAWRVFLHEMAAFAGPDRAVAPTAVSGPPLAGLTRREFELLRLAAAGLDNCQIAETLTLSVRTVERHLSNAYLKLGVSGKAAGRLLLPTWSAAAWHERAGHRGAAWVKLRVSRRPTAAPWLGASTDVSRTAFFYRVGKAGIRPSE